MVEPGLFPRLLGADYALLPGALRAVHDAQGTVHLAGLAEIERQPGFLPWLVCWISGLPEAGRDVPVQVEFIRRGSAELWKRCFGKRRYQSLLAPDADATPGVMIEHFGPFRFTFVLRADSRRLMLDLRKARFLGIPLPRFLAPRCQAEEREENGRFFFDIPLDLPLLGRVLHYKGWLERTEQNALL